MARLLANAWTARSAKMVDDPGDLDDLSDPADFRSSALKAA
jgi:hypothetical protein